MASGRKPRGILDLAREGRLTATVLIVNAPDTECAVRAWQAANPPADLGWHPNLTLDRPILPPSDVPSLVRSDGSFWPLGPFLRRICQDRIHFTDVRLNGQLSIDAFWNWSDGRRCWSTVINT